MSNSDETDPDQEVHESVRKAYRGAATESAPRHLDNYVLNQAARSVNTGRTGFRLAAWMGPATLAVTVALGLSIVWQYNLHLSPTVASDPGAADLADAVQSTGERLRNIDRSTDGLAPGVNLTDGLRPDRHCSAEATSAPDSWQACIDSLNQQGLVRAADSEKIMLKTAFPESAPVR